MWKLNGKHKDGKIEYYSQWGMENTISIHIADWNSVIDFFARNRVSYELWFWLLDQIDYTKNRVIL